MSRSYFLKTLCFILAAIGLLIFAAQPAAASTYYWDTNGTTAGSSGGTTAAGTWNTTNNFWNTDSTGGGGGGFTNTTTIGDDLVFAAGANATGSYTVTLSGTQSAGSLLFEEGNVTISGGTKITFANTGNGINTTTAGTVTISSVIDGTAGLTKNSPGTLTLSGTNTYTGDTIINTGKLEDKGTDRIPNASNVTVNNGSKFSCVGTANNTADTIGALTVNEGGVVAMDISAGPNTYFSLTVASLNTTGAMINLNSAGDNRKSWIYLGGNVTTIASATTAQVANIGSSANRGKLDLNGSTRIFDVADGAAVIDLDVNAPISNEGGAGTPGLTKNGTGTMRMSGDGTGDFGAGFANTYTGLTTVNAGTLILAKKLLTNGGDTNISIPSGGLAINNGGTVQYDSASTNTNQIANAAAITVNTGGALDITTRSDTVGVVTLAGGTITGTTGVLTGSSYAMQSGTVNAILGGSGVTLTKTTSGIVSLGGANTYTGTTTITTGMILVKLATALPSGSAVTVQSGATLAVDSGVTLTKTATWNSGSILGGNGKYDIGAAFGPTGIHIAPGLSVGTLTVDDGVNLSSGGILDIQVDGATADLLQVTKTSGLGNLTLGGTSVLNVTEIIPGTFTQIAIVTYAGTRTNAFATTNLPAGYSISYDDANKQILLLPEPATMALLGLGAFGMAFNRRRRR